MGKSIRVQKVKLNNHITRRMVKTLKTWLSACYKVSATKVMLLTCCAGKQYIKKCENANWVFVKLLSNILFKHSGKFQCKIIFHIG